MLRTEIDKDEPLQAGDVIEMHFKAYGPNWLYLRAAELALIKWRCEQAHTDYELLSWQAPGDKLILTFKVLKTNPVVVTAAIIAAMVIGGGVFAWLALDKVYKIATTPAAQVALAGTGALGITFAVIVGYLILSRYYGWGD